MVNGLVREKTHGKIDHLISREDIDEFTKFIILNCVYFKKTWLHSFDEKWGAEEFRGATKISHVKYLYHKIAGQRYYEGSGYDIVELPYKESDIACYLIVPTAENLFSLFNRFSEVFGHIAEVKSGMDVELTVPPFKVESTINLIPPTKMAGVTNIFRKNQDWLLIDLEKLATDSWMKVSFIRQKAYIDFTKDGTEVAAATAIGILCCSGCMSYVEPPPTKVVRADKPFIYVLANRAEPDRPLFVGVVNEVPDAPVDTLRMNPYDISELGVRYT